MDGCPIRAILRKAAQPVQHGAPPRRERRLRRRRVDGDAGGGLFPPRRRCDLGCGDGVVFVNPTLRQACPQSEVSDALGSRKMMKMRKRGVIVCPVNLPFLQKYGLSSLSSAGFRDSDAHCMLLVSSCVRSFDPFGLADAVPQRGDHRARRVWDRGCRRGGPGADAFGHPGRATACNETLRR